LTASVENDLTSNQPAECGFFFNTFKENRMNKSSKTEIVIPTWEGHSGPRYWGDHDYGSLDNQTSSFWVSFRGVVLGDPYSYMTEECRAIGDMGLYVWIEIDGTVIIDLRLHDVGSLTLRECEQRIKGLKSIYARAKAYPFNNFQRKTDVHAELTRVLDAIGIKRALVYHGINTTETFEPVRLAIRRISDCVDARLERMRLRRAA